MTVQRYKVGYYTDEWGMSSNTPCLLPDPNGYAVKYLDYAEIEKQRDDLLADIERCHRMLLSEPDTKGALFKAENILRDAIASVKEK